MSPIFSRAVIIGVIGAVGLALTVTYSRRGPMIFPVYAAILAALALLAARYPASPFSVRFTATLAGFLVSSAGLSVMSDIKANKDRQRLVADGRLPATALQYRVSPAAYAARFALLAVIGSILSVAVAFVAG